MGKLVWLASYPKSGNTWVRAFLHNYLRQPEAPHDINRLHDMTLGESDAAHFAAHDPRPASQYTIADVQRMRPYVHAALTRAYPDLVFVKTHNAMLSVGGVGLLTPEATAGAIYLVRDPRDVAVSYARHLDRDLDAVIALLADRHAVIGGDDAHVHEHLSSWSVHVRSWTLGSNPRLLVLRYEDMHADPGSAFGRVVRFLGQDPPLDRLVRAIAFSRFGILRDQERAQGFNERPATAEAFFRSGRAGAWRDVLSPAQAAAIALDHGETMERFGYL